jgi:hypothetical protein
MPFEALDTSTFAPGMGAFDGSVTIPRRTAPVPGDCASAIGTTTARTNETTQHFLQSGTAELSKGQSFITI